MKVLSCEGDLDLDPMTFIYELSLEIYRMREKELLICQGFRKLPSERQTDRQAQAYIQTDTSNLTHATS